MKKIYKVGEEYAIGTFSNGELLKGSSPRYYKTKKGALRALKKR